MKINHMNLKSSLSNPSRIFKIEAIEAVLWLIKRVYFILTHPVYNMNMNVKSINIKKFNMTMNKRLLLHMSNHTLDSLKMCIEEKYFF